MPGSTGRTCPRRIPAAGTLLAIHRALACVTHSREWMPASSQMAGRLDPPVLNWGKKQTAAPQSLARTAHHVLWDVLCLSCIPLDTPCGFWRYLQDVQRAFLVGFPDLDLFHKAVLRCKVVQLLVNLQGEVMRTLKSYLCVLPFLPESHGLIQVGSIPFHPSATGRDTFHHPKLFLEHSQGWGSHSFSG